MNIKSYAAELKDYWTGIDKCREELEKITNNNALEPTDITGKPQLFYYQPKARDGKSFTVLANSEEHALDYITNDVASFDLDIDTYTLIVLDIGDVLVADYYRASSLEMGIQGGQ